MEEAAPGVKTVEIHEYTQVLPCQRLLHVPEQRPDLLVLALHGYGMNAKTMLDLTLLLLGPSRLIASLQAPNRFYLGEAPSSRRFPA